MAKIKHRFIQHKISPETETLIVGTFNPDTEENEAEFFYGRSRNFLWTLIPTSFGETSLKGQSKSEKKEFIKQYKIDFIDLISEVEVDEVSNYDDAYLDNKVVKWTDVITEIQKLPNLKRVGFTRKTVADIPQMKNKIEEIKKYCEGLNVPFKYLPTPARFYSIDKQDVWSKFFNDGK